MKKIILTLIIFFISTLFIINSLWTPDVFAQADSYKPLRDAVAPLLQSTSRTGIYIVLPTGEEITNYKGEQFPAYSVIKLWIAAGVLAAVSDNDNPLGEQTLPLIERMLTESNNETANTLIDAYTDVHIGDRIQAYIGSNNFNRTILARKMLENPTPQADNLTSPQDAITFMQRLLNGQIVNPQVSDQIISILRNRTANGTDPFKPNSTLPANADFIGKSGILGVGRNDVGSFLDKNGNRVYFAIFVPNGGTGTDQVISNLEQLAYDPASPTTALPPSATQPSLPGSQTAITARACVKVGSPSEAKPAVCSQPTSGSQIGPNEPRIGGVDGINITCPIDRGGGFRYICGTSTNVRNGCGHGNPTAYTACIPGIYVCPFGPQLKSAVDVRPLDGNGNNAAVFLPYINGNQSVTWTKVAGPIAISGGSWGYRYEFETTSSGKRIRLDMTHINKEITSSVNSGEQIGTVYSGFDTDGGGHLHTAASIDGQWIDSISDSFYCSK